MDEINSSAYNLIIPQADPKSQNRSAVARSWGKRGMESD